MEKADEFNETNIKRDKKLGSGAFGDVYSGYLSSSGKKIAIKRVSKQKMREINYEYMQKAFFTELDCMKKCNCENSVLFYKSLETQNNYNIIMELCDGDLAQELDKRPKGFSTDEVRFIMSQINNAFKKMVENKIIHRDLKLKNILIKYTNEEKTEFIPKLSDYGLSKEMSDKSIIAKTNLGTPATKAPEIMIGSEYDNKVDLWSVGVLMYQLHFNELPYKGMREQDIIRNIKKKVPYKQAEDYFLRDLISKLLVEDPINRISWEQYFEHPFFKSEEQRNEILTKIKNNETKIEDEINVNAVYIGKDKRYVYIKDFDLGYKSDLVKCVIARDKKGDKLVFIKIYNEEFIKSHDLLFKNEFHLYRTFTKSNNVLQLINIQKDKDTYLIFDYVDCEVLPNYLLHHSFDEKDFQLFHKELFINVFNYSEVYFKPFIFLSLFSFAMTKEGKPIIFDFGIHKFFLPSEEVMSYYIPNRAEIAESLNPIKTNIMNYGITLLKCFYGNNLKLDIEDNKITLPSNKILSKSLEKFLSKCLKKNIMKRASWDDLKKEVIMKNIFDDDNNINDKSTKINNEPENIISDKKLKGILRSLDKKYELINKYYDSIEINENTLYVHEMEKFLILTLFEQLILSKILNQAENEKYKDMAKEISFIDIINDKAEELRINFASPVLKNMKIFNNNINNPSIKEFIPKLNEHLKKLKEISKKFHIITQSSYFKGNYQDFLKGFSDLISVGIENFKNYFLSLTKEANNDWLNNDYKNAELKAPIAEYLSEIVLFLVMNIVDIEKEKIFFYNNKDLLKNFKEIFEKENEENVEVSCIKFAKEKDKYILVSFLGILFKFLINACDIEKINIKRNKNSLNQLLLFYQKLMKTLLDIK